ncbi:fimbria/pilus outer membrane usher protein, partial [Serratia marcescens]|uniref:fimbria/pilus outer membrane usher protein n=1 Tax=Serratia marcescens TaxID=615 RepID=UPI001CA3572F
MTANKYQSLAGGADISPVRELTLSTKILSARDQLNDNKGQQIMLSANYVTPFSLSFNVSGTQNTEGYRDLLDTFNDDDTSTHTKNDYAFSTGWSNDLAGSFSLGYSRSVGFSGSDDSTRVTTSWSKTFKYVAVSASWQHEIDNDSGRRNDDNTRNNYQNGGDTFYVNLSIPFGTQSVNT